MPVAMTKLRDSGRQRKLSYVFIRLYYSMCCCKIMMSLLETGIFYHVSKNGVIR